MFLESLIYFNLSFPRHNETVTRLCKSCYEECGSVWFDVKDLQVKYSNDNCRRGVLYPYSCIFMVKQFVRKEDDDVNSWQENYEAFVQYMNEYSKNFWTNYQTYIKQFQKPFSYFNFTTPLPWNLSFI